MHYQKLYTVVVATATARLRAHNLELRSEEAVRLGWFARHVREQRSEGHLEESINVIAKFCDDVRCVIVGAVARGVHVVDLRRIERILRQEGRGPVKGARAIEGAELGFLVEVLDRVRVLVQRPLGVAPVEVGRTRVVCDDLPLALEGCARQLRGGGRLDASEAGGYIIGALDCVLPRGARVRLRGGGCGEKQERENGSFHLICSLSR